MPFHQILLNVNNQAALNASSIHSPVGEKGSFGDLFLLPGNNRKDADVQDDADHPFLLLRATEESCFSLTVRKGFRLCVSCSL